MRILKQAILRTRQMKSIFTLCFTLLAVSCSDQRNSTSNGGDGSIPEVEPVNIADSVSISIDVIASNLDVPWEIVWGPDNWIWYTEKDGSISKLNPLTGEKKLLLHMPEVLKSGTKGLLCMALHPNFGKFPYVVVNYQFMKDRHVKKDFWSRWVRFTYDGKTLKDPLIYFEETAEAGHNGSRVTFAPDGTVLMAVGDGDNNNDERNSGVAQNMEMHGGKVLRYNLDGTIPDDNPFPGSPVWALGFRVPQGMVFASNGNLYTSEHGHNTNDEVNLVSKGQNYGYPNVSGVCNEPREMDFCAQHNVQPPIMAWTPTVAPSGIAYYDHNAIPQWKNALLLVTLKTQSLRVLKLNNKGDSVVNESVYLAESFGRLRDICISPAGDVYIATGNRDWTGVDGFPQEKDDRIIKLSAGTPAAPTSAMVPMRQPPSPAVTPGSVIYKDYCASCHKSNGAGLADYAPSLATSSHVSGDVDGLIRIVLNGQHSGNYETDMPAFSFLSNDQIAKVVEYVRLTFGHEKGSVTPEQVDNLRNEGVTK